MAVERFKHDGEWKIIGSSSGKVQISDDKLDSESINSVQNKVITKALENKADIVDKLVNAYGIRSVSNTEYYMPDIGGVNPARTLATKADIINSGSSENKATMYNLYAMDDLTAEQLAANETAFEAVQNGEVALYRVYTNDTAYALADVKIVDGPYLEAYVYVNTPNADSKQATITKYTYTFEQGGEYYTADKEEVILPSIDKVNELVGNGGSNVYPVYVFDGITTEQQAANVKAVEAVNAYEDNAVFVINTSEEGGFIASGAGIWDNGAQFLFNVAISDDDSVIMHVSSYSVNYDGTVDKTTSSSSNRIISSLEFWNDSFDNYQEHNIKVLSKLKNGNTLLYLNDGSLSLQLINGGFESNGTYSGTFRLDAPFGNLFMDGAGFVSVATDGTIQVQHVSGDLPTFQYDARFIGIVDVRNKNDVLKVIERYSFLSALYQNVTIAIRSSQKWYCCIQSSLTGTTFELTTYEDGKFYKYIFSRTDGSLTSKEEIPFGSGGGSTAVDTELSLTSNNPVSNAVITSNIGVRVVEVDINTMDGWQQVLNTLISQGDNGAFIPVFCMLEGQTAYVYGVAALGLDGSTTSLAAICNGKTYVSPGGTKAMEYPFLFTDDLTKKQDNLLKTVLCNDYWNEAVLEIDGLRYRANEFKLESGYVTFKVVIGNELRTYAIYRLDTDGIEAGTLTLLNTEYIGSGGGGSITLDTEMSDTSENAVSNKVIKEYVDNAVSNSGGGGGSTAETELRPLYVPELTAGSELTDTQKAYNEETCQKMLNGAAMAVVSDGTTASYSDNIIDLTPMGAEGYVVHFKGVGGVYVIGGDVMVTLPDVSTSAIIPEDIAAENAADITNLIIALSIAGSLGYFPAFYLEKGDIRRSFHSFGMSMGVLILNIEYYDNSTRVASTYLLGGDGSGGAAVTHRYPTKIYLAPSSTEKEDNVDWMKTRHNIPREVPTLKYGGIEYYPISINSYSTNTGYADFTIYRDEAFETWRMMDDGSTTKL